ncbi:uncharacterized protein LOC131043306 [Cryptomeria japonica]|uniref:uncharacterized protein LOC131043306 n=1 Tax=Cryptomeria japonica TaxID=3369 RepID=UPI0027DAADFB|nr:uncharacterized protein LOC131043306 [Cryptomeria japonica]
MVDSITICEVKFKTPSEDDLKGPILTQKVADVKATIEEQQLIWRKKRCIITIDGWTNRRNSALLNFFVSSSGATMSIKSINVSRHTKNATYLCEALEEVPVEVGKENEVQAVINNATNYVATGRLLMERHPTLFWTPCVDNCLDLILEDLVKLSWIKKFVDSTTNICKFLYNHTRVLSIMRQYTRPKELVCPGIIRFATNLITLQSLIWPKVALRHMFVSEE